MQLGISTRAAISLLRASQARAMLAGRDYVIPEDILAMAQPVLAHRIVLSPEARNALHHAGAGAERGDWLRPGAG
jgi:MoxR-like ATPase